MTRNPNEIEHAVSRTLRDSLEKLQRTTEELNQAIHDLVSACASTRPSNSLPPMLRAQTSAASLSASLEVLSRFVTAALQPGLRSSAEHQVVADLTPAPEVAAEPSMAQAAPAQETRTPPQNEFEAPTEVQAPEAKQKAAELDVPAYDALVIAESVQADSKPGPVISESMMESQPIETPMELRSSDMVEEGAPIDPARSEDPGIEIIESTPLQPEETPSFPQASKSIEQGAQPFDAVLSQPIPDFVEELPVAREAFDLSKLRQEEQDLHRRADRVAKVAMQDIKMLHPEDVKLGKEHKDLCVRLRDDIERARREYDRRFHSILDHPVDYFYNRMVEILGDGNADTLGEYPYPSPVLRR